MNINDLEDDSNRTLLRSENKNVQKRKSMFLMKIEENIDSLSEAVSLNDMIFDLFKLKDEQMQYEIFFSF